MVKFSEMPYRRPSMKDVCREFELLLERFESAPDGAQQKETLYRINDLRKEYQTYASIASVRNSLNTTDAYYEAEQEFFDETEPIFKELNIRLYKALGNSKFKDELRQKFGNQLFKLADVSVKSFDPSIIDDLKEENKLGTEYTKLIASAEVEFQGRKRTLSALAAFAHDPDREVRRQANAATQSFFKEHEKTLDSIFDRLVRLRHGMARKLGYQNFVELGYYRMNRTDYTAADVATFRNEIETHVVPLAAALREKQRQRIGVEKLKIYDLAFYFPSGNPKPKGSPAEIVAKGRQMYAELSPETKEFFEFMVNHELMDLENRKGKAAGGYCTMFEKYKAPFIFANFNGTTGDVDVLTHEAGHAFQCFQSRDYELGEYLFPTLEACEIHSMSMEHLTYPWMKLFFEENADKYIYMHLAGCVLFLPYGVAVDEFQHIIYENPDLTPDERKRVWLAMEQKYRPWVDYDGDEYLERGGLWQRQLHIYRSPFYYIDYCLAQVCAFQMWSRSLRDFQGAWADYLRLCKAGGSDSFLGLVKLARLRSPFERGLLQPLMGEIEEYLNGLEPKLG
ncbi:MAG: M3 family oligoendopeptidase [Chitinophagales bacterium]|nr:M3 family oligoendopeptidase [Chitinophagales bacterium]MDW8418118.1 M3 family oligoendopeptidase [Chitinophagales bacterium]